MEKKITLVRHGQTDYNYENKNLIIDTVGHHRVFNSHCAECGSAQPLEGKILANAVSHGMWRLVSAGLF